MKTVSIYNPGWAAFGGGEKYACAIAECLSGLPDVRVRLVITRDGISKERLTKYFNVNLEKVDVQVVRQQEVEQSLASADLAIVIFNFRLFGFPAKRNVYVIQIPYARFTATRYLKQLLTGNIKEAAKDWLRQSVLSKVKQSDSILVYSNFVKDVLHQYHNIPSTVLYPPIDDFLTGEPKEHVVLSVGRFFSGLYNDKRHDILIEGFKQLCDRLGSHSWRYHLVGSCTSDRKSQKYLASLKKSAEGYPVHFFVNMPYDELKRQYNQATIFWHATGYGRSEERSPESMEHFGMTTAEAMSTGCIPVVINRGGQKEIVQHGTSGFLWNTIDELVAHTTTVMKGGPAVVALREGARARFHDFDKERFSAHVIKEMMPYLS
jgi:glycosyltransferase involved in cell wall biosynthesis